MGIAISLAKSACVKLFNFRNAFILLPILLVSISLHPSSRFLIDPSLNLRWSYYMPEHVDREHSLPSRPTQKRVHACVGVEWFNRSEERSVGVARGKDVV